MLGDEWEMARGALPEPPQQAARRRRRSLSPCSPYPLTPCPPARRCSGDHTVKLSCCSTGRLVRVLSGHRRTPWVVRFHPRKPHLLASGSLDHEVRLWDASTGQCIARHTFGELWSAAAKDLS